ncbi:MAG: diguanylate cyclase, partial [Elusimicrobiota bacterium]
DRIKLYLADLNSDQLKGELAVDITRKVNPIHNEHYPVERATTRSMVETLWRNLRLDPWSRILEHSLVNHDKVLYLPLKIQAKEIGVLVIDNILSQTSIPAPIRNQLQSFAGQLALAVDNARLFSEVERLSLYDTLSLLPNRRYFKQRFQEELYRSQRSKAPFALCILDIDFFKEINDTYGHQIGDRAIACIGAAVNQVIRQSDFAARWGGDEVVILLGLTAAGEVSMVADRILKAIRDISIEYPADPPKNIKITASMGIAVYPEDGSDLESLMATADKALYHTKFTGRNGYTLASQVPDAISPQ